MDTDYDDFIKSKNKSISFPGIEAKNIPDCLFDYQKDITKWALKRGRAAVFAGTGLGKTLIELSWAWEVHRKTGGKVLIFAPLAVSHQIIRESNKFGMSASWASEQNDINHPVSVSNYHKINKFDLSKFKGIVLDESSILKNETGKYRNDLITKTKMIPYRLAATATPAPNDYMELGNHAEFLGIMSYTDMLATFFVHDAANTQKWRLKGWAQTPFWEWMSTWAVMLTQPQDLGYSFHYQLPDLEQIEHIIAVDHSMENTGLLFAMEAESLGERLTARRNSIEERCMEAAKITKDKNRFVWWCNLNKESERLCQLIPDAIEVKGADSDKSKERKLNAFSDGKIRVLITKPSICGFGMNWQHCDQTGFVGLNDSFEQVYQAIRRFWRFGQENPVQAHFISATTEGSVIANLKRKEKDFEHMQQSMIEHMADLSKTEIKSAKRTTLDYIPMRKMEIPIWIQ